MVTACVTTVQPIKKSILLKLAAFSARFNDNSKDIGLLFIYS